MFIDKNKSVCSNISAEDLNGLEELIWKRPGEIFKGLNYFIYDSINVDDIEQGILGNCYFLSSIAAIAEHPHRIEKIFVNKEISKNGCYVFNVFIQGKPKIVTIDDRLPVFKRNRWALARSSTSEIWVQLLEKLWGKLNQSYAMTIAGIPSDALSVMTEAPVITYIHRKYEDKNQLWNILKNCDDQNYIICTNSNSSAAKEVGLIESHAYTIISVYAIKEIKLMKIRNPWGKFEWNGDYGDKDSKWTKELKAKVKFEEKDDGIFYMSFSDFLRFFPFTFVCKYNDKYSYKYKKIYQKSQESFTFCSFKTTKKTNIVLGLHQKQERFYHKVKNYKPCYAKIFLVKVNKNSGSNFYEYITSNEGSLDTIYLDLSDDLNDPLGEGEYIMLANVNWQYYRESKTCSLVFSSYSDDPSLELNNFDTNTLESNFLQRMFDSLIDKKCKYEALGERMGIGYINSFKDTDSGFMFVSFKNDNVNPCKINFDIEINNKVKLVSQRFEVDQTNTYCYEYSLLVDAFSNEIILFEQLDDIWNCHISCKSIRIDFDKSLTNEDDKLFIKENRNKLTKENFIKSDIVYCELRRNKNLFIIIQNVSKLDYMLKVDFVKLVNCEIIYPEKKMFRLDSMAMHLIKLAQLEQYKEISYEFEYYYKCLSN